MDFHCINIDIINSNKMSRETDMSYYHVHGICKVHYMLVGICLEMCHLGFSKSSKFKRVVLLI